MCVAMILMLAVSHSYELRMDIRLVLASNEFIIFAFHLFVALESNLKFE